MIEQNTDQHADNKPWFSYGYVVVIAAFIMQMVMFGPRSSFGVFFKPLVSEFDWSRALLSGAFSLSTVVQGLSGIIMGGLNDRLGPRAVMALCAFLVGLGYLLMSQVNGTWQLYLFYVVLIGSGMGGLFVALLSTVARWFLKRRSVMTGIVMAGSGTGGLVVPPVINWLILAYGWRNSFIISGALVLVVGILASQFLRKGPTPLRPAPYADFSADGFSLREAIYTGQFWMTVVMLFCLGFAMITMMVHIVPHVTDLGILAAEAANILAVMSGAHLIGGIVLGSIADRIGNRQVFMISFVLIVAALFWLLTIREAWVFYIFAAVLGFGGSGGATLQSPLVADLFGIKSHGLLLGICAFCTTIGSALGPFIAGYIFDVSGSYQLAFWLCAAAAVVGLIIASMLRPPRRR